jgi:hypothetical protein
VFLEHFFCCTYTMNKSFTQQKEESKYHSTMMRRLHDFLMSCYWLASKDLIAGFFFFSVYLDISSSGYIKRDFMFGT